MPMNESNIENYLAQIQEATMGAQVRTAIYNAISECYTDITTGVTQLDTVLDESRAAIDSATEAAELADAAKEDYETARSEYESVVQNGSSYLTQMGTILSQFEAIQTNLNGIDDLIAEKMAAVDESIETVNNAASSASDSAETASGYVEQLNSISDRLETLEGMESTISDYVTSASDASTAASDSATAASDSANAASQSLSDISTLRDQVENLYNSFLELNPVGLSNKIDSVNLILSDPANLEDKFDGYNTTFGEYASTFGGYAATFDGYSSSFQDLLDSTQNVADVVTGLKNDCDTNLDTMNGMFAQIEGMDIPGKWSDITDAADRVEAALVELSDTNIDEQLIEFREIRTDIDETAAQVAASVSDLSDSISAANSAAASAEAKVNELTLLQSALSIVQSSWNDNLYPSIQSSLSSMASAIDTAQSAASTASTAAATTNELLSEVSAITEDWGSRRSRMDEYLLDAGEALTELEGATDSIDNMTVTSESVSYNGTASATISDVDGHKNIHFVLRNGAPGPGNVIKGSAYSTLEALQEDITDPEIGDQYNVGSAAPYSIYRWTGSEWENEGPYGVSVEEIDDSEIDAIYSNGSYTPGRKFLDINGLAYYTRTKLMGELDKKVSAVTGKGLSTNDFTNDYKILVDDNRTSITVLQSNKVDKVTGKGLSTNDFTNDLKAQITTNQNDISVLRNGKLSSDFDSYSSFIGNEWSTGLLAVKYGSSMYKLDIGQFVSSLASIGNYVQSSTLNNYVPKTEVATLSEARSYLGIS